MTQQQTDTIEIDPRGRRRCDRERVCHWLSQADQQVTILARGLRLAERRNQGLTVKDAATGQLVHISIATTDHLSPSDAYDLAIVAVRLDQVGEVLPVLAAAKQIPTVLFFLNNAFAVEQYAQVVGRERVVLGFPGIGGRRDGATIQYYVLPQQPTTLGDLTGIVTPRLRLLAELFRSTGQRVEITPRMDAWLKTHAVFVTCMAAAILQCAGVGEARERPSARRHDGPGDSGGLSGASRVRVSGDTTESGRAL